MKRLIFLVLVFICSNSNAQKATIKILDSVLIKMKSLTDTEAVIRLENGDKMPDGYKLVAKARWKSGPMTVDCSEEKFIELTEKKSRELGATHYKLVNFRRPIPFLNTCYCSKVLYLIKSM